MNKFITVTQALQFGDFKTTVNVDRICYIQSGEGGESCWISFGNSSDRIWVKESYDEVMDKIRRLRK